MNLIFFRWCKDDAWSADFANVRHGERTSAILSHTAPSFSNTFSLLRCTCLALQLAPPVAQPDQSEPISICISTLCCLHSSWRSLNFENNHVYFLRLSVIKMLQNLSFDHSYNKPLYLPTFLQLYFVADKNVSCGKVPPPLEDIQWPHSGLKISWLLFCLIYILQSLFQNVITSQLL